MIPFQALYGHLPPVYPLTHTKATMTPTVEEWSRNRADMTRILRERLIEAQNRMKQNADKKMVDKEYQIGEMVYLKLQPYRHNSVAVRRHLKLTSTYFGPFRILKKIGPVAYQLQLPEGSKIHSVFHVSLLKKWVPESQQAEPSMPIANDEGRLLAQPERIKDRRLVKRGDPAVAQVLIKWSNLAEEEATWEDY